MFIPEANETTPDIVAKLNASGLDFQYKLTGDNAIISAHPIGEATALPYITKAAVTLGSTEIAAYAAHLQYQWYATYLPRGYGAATARLRRGRAQRTLFRTRLEQDSHRSGHQRGRHGPGQ